jgi:bidirectional [NiFe] hydrogenase diaphorase subunit
MKNAKPVLPSQDKRWKIVDAKMRRYGYQANALIETLHSVQQSFGYLDQEALRFVARSLQVPPSKVYGVSTFYHYFSLKPQGAHTCLVCLGTACYVKGSDKLLSAIEMFAGIKAGETTADKQVSLLTARCIGPVRPRQSWFTKVTPEIGPRCHPLPHLLYLKPNAAYGSQNSHHRWEARRGGRNRNYFGGRR